MAFSIITGKDDNDNVVSRSVRVKYDNIEIEIDIDYRNDPNGEVIRCNTYTF